MTALNTPIVFNSSTGNDATASGSPSTRAFITTLSLQITAGSATTYGTANGAINVGDLVYVPSQTSGRKFNVIASINTSVSPTVYTFDEVWDASDFSATCYSGGKRATFDNADSRRLFGDDCAAGFVIETETDQSLTSTILLSHGLAGTNQGVTIRGSAAHKVINQTVNDETFDTPNWSSGKTTFRYLKFTNSNASKGNAIAIRISNQTETFTFRNCVFGDATNTLRYGIYGLNYARTVVHQCLFTDSEIGYHAYWNPSGNSSFTECVVRNMSSHGYNQATREQNTVVNSVFYNCGGYGVHITGEGQVIGCICHGNTSGGIALSPSYGNESTMAARNILVSNGGYGIHSVTSVTYGDLDNVFDNAYFNNTSGQALNANIDPITLTADPFVDAAAGDFNLNADAGGGDTLRANNYALNTDTGVYPFRQYVSDPFGGGGGGGSTFHPLAQ